MNYKQNQILKGLLWSGIDKIGIVVFQLVLEIFLARLLLPKDYGVVGIILVFISLATVFTEGGFSNALIHKQDRTETDFTAVFYFNLVMAVIIYLIIFFAAPYVENLYKISNLTTYLRVAALSIVLSAMAIVHKTKLSILMDFQTQAKCSLVAVIISGILSLVMAYYGYGVWSLIIQILLLNFINTITLWIVLKWVPQLYFSYNSIKGLFGFGSKILLASIIQSTYFNSYPILIGKFLSIKDLGVFSKSNQFTLMPASVFSSILQRVLFPFFASHQNDDDKIFQTNQMYTLICCLIFFPFFFTLAAVSEPLVLVFFSSKWSEMIGIFTMFCFSFSIYPVSVNNMMIFQVKNKTKLFLNVEIITKLIGVVILIVIINRGIVAIGFGILIQQTVQLLITSIIVQKLLKEKIFSQLKIILPLFIFSLFNTVFVKYLLNFLHVGDFSKVIVGSSLSLLLFSIFYSLFYRNKILEVVDLLKKARLN